MAAGGAMERRPAVTAGSDPRRTGWGGVGEETCADGGVETRTAGGASSVAERVGTDLGGVG